MMVDENCRAVDEQKRRPWYRLHRSTAVVLLLVVGAMVLVNVPGRRRVTKFRPFHRYLTIDEELHHGWPSVYLRREYVWPIFVSSQRQFWSLRTGVIEFRLAAMLFDVLIALLVTIVVAGLWQWRRSQRRRLLQLHLSDMLVIMLIWACLLGWICHLYRSDQRQQRGIAQLELSCYRPRDRDDSPWMLNMGAYAQSHAESTLPDWLVELGGPIPRWETVVGLRLNTVGFDDETLAQLEDFPDVKYLSLAADFTDEGLRHLKHLRRLKWLEPQGTMGDEGLAHLKGLTRLEHLDLRSTRVTDTGMEYVAGLKNLRSLSLPSDITDKGFVHVARLTNLETLILDITKIDDDGLKHLGNLTRLKSVSLPWQVTGAGLVHLKRLANLRDLVVPEKTSDDDLEHVAHLHRLKLLYLSGRPIGDEGLRHVRSLTRLEELHLGYTEVTAVGLERLGQLHQLRKLDLAGPQTSDAFLVRLQAMRNLEELDLRETQVTDSGLRHLARLTELKSLELASTPVGDAGVVHLRALRNLESLGLWNTKVTAEGVRKLKQALPNCQVVR